LSDDNGISEKVLSLTTGKNTEAPEELEFMNILSMNPSVCTINIQRSYPFL